MILDRGSQNGSRERTALEEQRLRLTSESPALEFQRFRESVKSDDLSDWYYRWVPSRSNPADSLAGTPDSSTPEEADQGPDR